MPIREELRRLVADEAAAQARAREESKRAEWEYEAWSRHEAALRAKAGEGSDDAAYALFAWTESDEGRELRAKMRAERVREIKLGPTVDSTGTAVRHARKGSAWLMLDADERPTLRIRTYLGMCGGPFYVAQSADQLARHGRVSLLGPVLVAAARALGLDLSAARAALCALLRERVASVAQRGKGPAHGGAGPTTPAST